MDFNFFKSKNLAIAIMARDCESSLRHHIPQVEKLCSYFSQSMIIVVENDSVDGTKDILSKWSSENSNLIVLTEDNSFSSGDRNGAGVSRIERMVHYRNIYLNYLRNSNQKVDYVVMIDIDIDGFHYEDILNAIINAPDTWSAIFANGRYYSSFGKKKIIGKYYDNYAFVPYNSEYFDLTFREIKLNNDYINHNLARNNYFRCKSAFGGIGIYKYDDIKDFNYKVIENKRSNLCKAVCEHVSINVLLNNCYVCKNLLVFYERISFIKLFFDKLKRQTVNIFIREKILKQSLI